jgi:hypothetical protein
VIQLLKGMNNINLSVFYNSKAWFNTNIDQYTAEMGFSNLKQAKTFSKK